MAESQTTCLPSAAETQAKIDNLHWQERQQDIANAFGRQNAVRQQTLQQHQYMVDHLATPCTIVMSVAIIASTIAHLVRKSIAADIQKNTDDNQADVRYAQHLIDKHEVEQND